jgi:CBS domain-containing protein
MKVSDILRLKGQTGGTLYTIHPTDQLISAVNIMADKDMGSLLVMEAGDLVGLLTFREVIQALSNNGGNLGDLTVRHAMQTQPLICTTETDIDEVRRMMLESHARYMPILDNRVLQGVISFYDVAKSVVDSQNFENQMLKAYIKDWPAGSPDDK